MLERLCYDFFMIDKDKKPTKKRKDLNELAFSIVQKATNENPEDISTDKNPAAVALGRLGGLKGGPARAKKLTKEQRKEIARNAALKRWQKK